MEKFKELSMEEMQEMQGGIIPFIVAGVCLLLAGCGNTQTNNNYSGSNSTNINSSGTVATDSASVTDKSVTLTFIPK